MSESKAWSFIVPSLLGMAIFYFVPAAVSLFYAFTDVAGRFVLFANFMDVLTSSAFRLAARNTLLFILISVSLNVAVSFFLASLLQKLRYKKALAVLFMVPLVVPSGATVFFWNAIFSYNGAINRLLLLNGFESVHWFNSDWAFYIVLAMFLLKHIGFNIVLFMAGYQFIPDEYYEIAKIEGAGVFTTFREVTFIYMLPTTFTVLMMSMVNAFRVFRELYLLFGQHPHPSTYLLQHYMNSQFLAANMQRLSTAAFMLSLAVIMLTLGVFTAQRRMADNF